MNLQQLEYIVAVDKYRHFVRAAESCNISQSTLSSLIQKLENELNIVIFDRNSHPVCPTPQGENIINQARIILYNTQQLKEMVLSEKGLSSGELKLGVIPTVAPYILPKFFKALKNSNGNIRLRAFEMRTAYIVEKLLKAELDMAILATPLENKDLLEIPLYYEKFVAYISPTEELYKQKEIESSQMPSENLWVLQEGHCFRNQIFNLCNKESGHSVIYEAGSIDTLVKIVDENGGYTIIPQLHIDLLSKEQQANIRVLSAPEPVREISLVIRTDYVRERMLNIVADTIKTVIPEDMLDSRLKKFAIKL